MLPCRLLSDLALIWEEKEIIEFSKTFHKHHYIEQVDEQEQEFWKEMILYQYENNQAATKVEKECS